MAEEGDTNRNEQRLLRKTAFKGAPLPQVRRRFAGHLAVGTFAFT